MKKADLVKAILELSQERSEKELGKMTNAKLEVLLKGLKSEGDGEDPPPPDAPKSPPKYRVISGSVTLDDGIRHNPGDVLEGDIPEGFMNLVERV